MKDLSKLVLGLVFATVLVFSASTFAEDVIVKDGNIYVSDAKMVNSADISTVKIATGSITDSTGEISLENTNLTTTGVLNASQVAIAGQLNVRSEIVGGSHAIGEVKTGETDKIYVTNGDISGALYPRNIALKIYDPNTETTLITKIKSISTGSDYIIFDTGDTWPGVLDTSRLEIYQDNDLFSIQGGNGEDVFFFGKAGEFGIGTEPSSQLHMKTSSGGAKIIIDGQSQSVIDFRENGTTKWYVQSDAYGTWSELDALFFGSAYNAPRFWFNTAGNMVLPNDDQEILFGGDGTKNDFGNAKISYDGTDLVVDTDAVGSGSAKINSLEIDKDGFLKPVSAADTSAPNNAIYYSATQGKLVYKDSSGTVNALY